MEQEIKTKEAGKSKWKKIYNRCCVIVFVALAAYIIPHLHFQSTGPAESVRILANIKMRQDYAEAEKIGFQEKHIAVWKKEFMERESKKARMLLQSNLRGADQYITEDMAQKLAEAMLTLNKKRKITAELVSEDGDGAVVKVTAAKVNLGPALAAVHPKMLEAMKAKGIGDSDPAVIGLFADILAESIASAQATGETNSTELACRKYDIDGAPVESRNAEQGGGIKRFLLESVLGKCWRPVNPDDLYQLLS